MNKPALLRAVIAEIESDLLRQQAANKQASAGATDGEARADCLAGFARFVKGSIDAADQLGTLSVKTGVTVENLSKLGYAAELADSNINDLGVGLEKLTVSQARALAGNEATIEAFRKFGITQMVPGRWPVLP